MDEIRCREWLQSQGLDCIPRPVALSHRPGWILKPSLGMLLAELSLNCPGLTVVQVGAFDGSTGDPLDSFLRLEPAVRAVLIEPQPIPYAALRTRYSGSGNVTTVNAAITATNGLGTLYVVDDQHPGDPWWCSQIASFSRAHLLRHAASIRNLPDRIRGIDVPTLTPATLMKDYRISRVDALVVDTEGADWEIVQLFLARDILPSIVYFEWRHLETDTIQSAVEILTGLGYRLEFLEADLIAFRSPSSRSTGDSSS
ncbi:MAG: FkbM family methyltransferase [Planctomycetes bacterium]|nr:FkbM family methyltransferase [Planctomycetota bacterium]